MQQATLAPPATEIRTSRPGRLNCRAAALLFSDHRYLSLSLSLRAAMAAAAAKAGTALNHLGHDVVTEVHRLVVEQHHVKQVQELGQTLLTLRRRQDQKIRRQAGRCYHKRGRGNGEHVRFPFEVTSCMLPATVKIEAITEVQPHVQ